MMPRGMRPRQLQRMMRQLGITVEELDGVEEVLIRTSTQLYRFRRPKVTMMVVKGEKTYQIVGEPAVQSLAEALEKEEEEAAEEEIPEADIELVATTANVSFEEARKALEECNGNPAEAILKLTEK